MAASHPISFRWIRELAEPYLRGYRALAVASADLRGFWFVHPAIGSSVRAKRANVHSGVRSRVAFFVGYILGAENSAFPGAEPPECAVWIAIEPAKGALHRRLVAPPDSLLRWTFNYIRLLTHRPPRFEFHPGEALVMVRHASMREWPRDKYEHFSRNFFIETLAWLVRSGLVRRLLAEHAGKTGPRRKS